MASTLAPDAARDGGTTVEWPTMVVAALIYSGWLALTWWHAALPIAVIVVAGGWLVA